MKPPRDIGSWLFAAGIIVFVVFVVMRPTLTAPTPGAFDGGASTLEAAISAAEGSDRVVFAVATADWCGPCQTYKRGALADPRVEAWLAANAEPVMIDVDASPEDAQALGVRGIPASFVIRDGRVVASRSGVVGAGSLLEWLEKAAAPDKTRAADPVP